MKSGPIAILAYSRKTLCRSSRISCGTESKVATCKCKALRQDITDEAARQSGPSELSPRGRTNRDYALLHRKAQKTPDVRAEMNRDGARRLFRYRVAEAKTMNGTYVRSSASIILALNYAHFVTVI